jgi:hypothetical protein
MRNRTAARLGEGFGRYQHRYGPSVVRSGQNRAGRKHQPPRAATSRGESDDVGRFELPATVLALADEVIE